MVEVFDKVKAEYEENSGITLTNEIDASMTVFEWIIMDYHEQINSYDDLLVLMGEKNMRTLAVDFWSMPLDVSAILSILLEIVEKKMDYIDAIPAMKVYIKIAEDAEKRELI